MQSQILPSRSALVDRIALQFEYGQNLICLVGPSGLGKSYIAESFITDKYPEFNKAFIQLSASTKDVDLMTELLQHSFRGPLVDHNLTLSQNFFNLYRQNPCGPCLWVLDGARHLSEEMAAELALLAKKSPTTLYILVTAQAPNMLPNALDIHLEPLSSMESVKLMSMFFKQLPMREDPIFQTFLKACQGNPALLLQWKNEQQVELRPQKNKSIKTSWHLALFSVLLALLMVAFIYQKELVALLPETQQNNDVDTVLPTAAAISTEAQQKSSVGAEISSALQTQNKEHTSAHIAPEPMTEQPNTALKEKMQSQQDIQAIVSALDVELPQVATDSLKVDDSARLNELVTSPQPEEHSIKADTKVDIAADEEAPKVSVQPKAVQLRDDSEWFLTRNDNEWVVQLLAVKDAQVAIEFIALHKLTDVKVYQMMRANSPWWVAVLGPYASLEEAKVIKSALPEEVLSGQPFFKKVDKIKQEINQSTR
ncbi:AAA family ATPase [Pseudoalteromonas sp. T1lg23B]|uniref:AAA family ATPase n=1 Tax=Pseudoalteromonas sp. T1lg23B TaxID=2077097 RepID=UPI000CF6769F|nr:AAA family ATPase [Pseudoalteromonas sp. T1lg23B]